MDLPKSSQSVQLLNTDDSESTSSEEEAPLFDSIKDSESFIISDADEELIILIEFNYNISAFKNSFFRRRTNGSLMVLVRKLIRRKTNVALK